MTDDWTIRRDCAFCGRERSEKDDNHGPECPYWDFFGPRASQLPAQDDPVLRWFERFVGLVLFVCGLMFGLLIVLVVLGYAA